jgi:2'-5' RNA ligase
VTSNANIRLFVAIFPPPQLVEQLAKAARSLADDLSPRAVSWTRPEQIHLTLNFLGNVERARLEYFQRAVESACRRGEPFSLRARGIGCFPTPTRPRILWAGLDGATAALEKLKAELDAHLAPLGYAPDPRPFQPHLTIGRVKLLSSGDRRHLTATLPQWRETEFGPCPVERVDLMQSLLSPRAAKYSIIESFAVPGLLESGSAMQSNSES